MQRTAAMQAQASASRQASIEAEAMGDSFAGTPTGLQDDDDYDDDADDETSGAVTPANMAAGGGAQPLLRTGPSTAANPRVGPGSGRGGYRPKLRKETVDVKGETFTVVDDEIQLDDDPRGETKIDELGHLLGGREWKIYTFTSPGRHNPKKLYMLSIDAARASGYRDSLYFFRKNPLVLKLNCTQAEKDMLIARGRLSANLKSRAVTMVSARNVFKAMGATFVRDGKYVIDDYYEDRALAEGHKPGEPAALVTYEPGADTGITAAPKSGFGTPVGGKTGSLLRGLETSNLISSQVGVGINAVFGGNGLQPFGRTWDPSSKKAKPAPHLTIDNWMHEYAKNARHANTMFRQIRTASLEEVQVTLSPQELPGEGVMEIEEWVDEEDLMNEEEAPAPQGAASASNSQLRRDGPATNGRAAITNGETNGGPVILNRAASPGGTVRVLRKRTVPNPLRGHYNVDTNLPHVRQDTQPTYSTVEFVDKVPRVYAQDDDGEPAQKRARLETEKAAGRQGLWTLDVLTDPAANFASEPLLPGMWDFRS